MRSSNSGCHDFSGCRSLQLSRWPSARYLKGKVRGEELPVVAEMALICTVPARADVAGGTVHLMSSAFTKVVSRAGTSPKSTSTSCARLLPCSQSRLPPRWEPSARDASSRRGGIGVGGTCSSGVGEARSQKEPAGAGEGGSLPPYAETTEVTEAQPPFESSESESQISWSSGMRVSVSATSAASGAAPALLSAPQRPGGGAAVPQPLLTHDAMCAKRGAGSAASVGTSMGSEAAEAPPTPSAANLSATGDDKPPMEGASAGEASGAPSSEGG